MRRYSKPSARENAKASVVLPTPGESSKRTCPLAYMAMSTLRMISSLPMMALPTSWMIWSLFRIIMVVPLL